MDPQDLIDNLDKFLGNTRPKEAPPVVKSARELSRRIDAEIAYLKKKCLDGPTGCGSPTGSKGVYKSGRCENHYKVHEANLSKKRAEEGRESIGEDGYVRTYDANGKWRLKHRIVMEAKLGRPLLRSEVVIFLDKDKTNCSPDNLTIRTPNGEIVCPSCNHTFTLS